MGDLDKKSDFKASSSKRIERVSACRFGLSFGAVCLFVCLSVCLFVCLSVCLSWLYLTLCSAGLHFSPHTTTPFQSPSCCCNVAHLWSGFPNKWIIQSGIWKGTPEKNSIAMHFSQVYFFSPQKTSRGISSKHTFIAWKKPRDGPVLTSQMNRFFLSLSFFTSSSHPSSSFNLPFSDLTGGIRIYEDTEAGRVSYCRFCWLQYAWCMIGHRKQPLNGTKRRTGNIPWIE